MRTPASFPARLFLTSLILTFFGGLAPEGCLTPVFSDALRSQPDHSGLEQSLHSGLEEPNDLSERETIPQFTELSPEVAQFAGTLPGRQEIAGVWPSGNWSTQLMLEAMERLKPLFSSAGVLDVGTGSGVLILDALERLNAARVVATDIHELSLQVAALNASWKKVNPEKLQLLLGSLFDPVQGRRFDVVLCNAANPGMAEAFVYQVADYLAPDGVALLMWTRSQETGLRAYAHQAKLSFIPVLENPGGWRVFAMTASATRLQQIQSLMQSPQHSTAGLEEQERLLQEAERRVIAVIKELTKGRPVRWQVVDPTWVTRYPFLKVLTRHSELPFSTDPGNPTGTQELVDELARKSPPIEKVVYHRSLHRYFEAFVSQAEIKKAFSVEENYLPLEDLSPPMVLQRIFQGFFAQTGDAQEDAVLARVRFEQLAQDLELLGEGT